MFKPNHQRFLKIKIKSLAEESVIIRKEEGRAYSRDLRTELYLHRIGIVRRESRASQLVYAYLRGRSLKSVEQNQRYGFVVKQAYLRAKIVIKKFGTRQAVEGFDEWLVLPI